jgi:hypothetical protein
MKHWWCMECQAEVGLGKHGQCELCGSEAVDSLPADEELTRSVSVENEQTEPAPACV